MYRVRQSGLGASCPGQTASIFSQPGVVWDYILHGCPTAIGTPPAPPQSVWTTPPASGADAQSTVDTLLNQQMTAQQAADAAGVQSSWWDSVTGGTYSAGSAAGAALSSYLPWVLGGLALFAVVAVGGGSPRRYGR